MSLYMPAKTKDQLELEVAKSSANKQQSVWKNIVHISLLYYLHRGKVIAIGWEDVTNMNT